MKRVLVACAASVAVAALGCSSGDHPSGNVDLDTGLLVETSVVDSGGGGDTRPVDGTTDGGKDASDSSALDSSTGDSSTSDSSGSDSTTGDSSAEAPSDTTVFDTGFEAPPDAGPPTCDPTKDWTTVADDPLTSLSTVGSDDFLGGVTPDELTIVWVTISDPDVFVKVADRADKTSAFGTPQTVTGSFGFSGVTVSADGLQIIATDATRKSLVRVTRAVRGDLFGSADTTGFANVDALAGDGPTRLGDPTLTADGMHLTVIAAGLAISPPLYESSWTGTAWDMPVRQTGPWTGIARPSSFAFDGRTLFLTDSTNTGFAAYRPAIGWPTYDKLVSLGAHAFAATNAACNKLYFSRGVNPDGSDLDLFVTR